MRSALLLILLFSIYLVSQGQSVQRVFNKGYANEIIATSDGGFIVTGDLTTNSSDRNFLLKLDSVGHVDWLKNYHDLLEFFSYGISVVEIPGEGFVSAGLMFHDTISNEEVTLQKSDLSGNPLWTKSFGNPFEDDEVKSIITIPDGYLLGGTNSGYGHGLQDLFLIKTDTAGNILSSKIYGSFHDEIGKKILHYQNGFIFGGEGREDSTGEKDIFLMYLDSSENIISVRRFIIPGDQQLYDIIVKDDGGILLAATTGVSPDSERSLFISLSPVGNIQWSNILSGNYTTPFTLKSIPNGFIAAGSIHPQLNNENALVVVMDSSGNLFTENCFGDQANSTVRSLILRNDTLICAGSFSPPGSTIKSIYLNKYFINDTSACHHFYGNDTFQPVAITIDSLSWQVDTPSIPEANALVVALNTIPSDSDVCDIYLSVREIDTPDEILIAPNPASENTTISFNGFGLVTTFSIYRSTGELVNYFSTEKNSIDLSTNDLKNGVYFIQLLNNKYTTCKKLIIQ